METVLILLLLLFLYLVINNYRKCEGFSGECSSESLVEFYNKINKEYKDKPEKYTAIDDKLEEKLRQCRYEDDIDTFRKWAESL